MLADDAATCADDVPVPCFRRLAAAVLIRAVWDARKGDDVAAAWLHSDGAKDWADLLELERWPPDPAMIGCPDGRRSMSTEMPPAGGATA